MDKDQQELKEFLEQQLQWIKKQDAILQEIDEKLHEMKRIAEYRLEHELSSAEINELNRKLNELKRDVHVLENQLREVVH
jgi:predicted metal-dependent hydrolase